MRSTAALFLSTLSRGRLGFVCFIDRSERFSKTHAASYVIETGKNWILILRSKRITAQILWPRKDTSEQRGTSQEALKELFCFARLLTSDRNRSMQTSSEATLLTFLGRWRIERWHRLAATSNN